MATEKRLIDANAVDYENIMCSQAQLHWLNHIIEKQPTVDAVEVVRCKDCIHRKHDTINDEYVCNHDRGALIVVEDSDYCSCGERKENEYSDY